MTRQTSGPLRRLALDTSNRQARWLVHMAETGELDINPPYQRGAVWTEDQRVALMRSLLSGVPIPTLIINDRDARDWTDVANYDPDAGGPSYALIDGKQRLMTLAVWFAGGLAIPASWVDSGLVDQTEHTGDGPYVRFTGLNETGHRVVGERLLLPVSEARATTLRAEADIYLLVNGQGTPHTDEDMARAAAVAGQEASTQ